MNLVGITAIGDMLGVSKQRASQLASSKGFPKPVDPTPRGRRWRRADVERWAKRNRP